MDYREISTVECLRAIRRYDIEIKRRILPMLANEGISLQQIAQKAKEQYRQNKTALLDIMSNGADIGGIMACIIIPQKLFQRGDNVYLGYKAPRKRRYSLFCAREAIAQQIKAND